MELENVTLSKIIQVQKDRHCILSSRYGFRLLIFFIYVFICESRGGCLETRRGSMRGERKAFREGAGRAVEHRCDESSGGH